MSIMDSGPSVAAGTRAHCTKLPGVCVFWKPRLEEVVTGGSEVHAGHRWTWAMQGSALPVLWNQAFRIYHSLTHQPNFQLPGGKRGLSGSWKPLCQCSRQARNASQRCLPGAALCDRWELENDYPSSLTSGELSLRCRPHSHPRVLSAEAHGSQGFLFFPVFTSPLLSGSTPWKVPALKSLPQGLLLVEPKLRCWPSEE